VFLHSRVITDLTGLTAFRLGGSDWDRDRARLRDRSILD
jgi:hypothetical protein